MSHPPMGKWLTHTSAQVNQDSPATPARDAMHEEESGVTAGRDWCCHSDDLDPVQSCT